MVRTMKLGVIIFLAVFLAGGALLFISRSADAHEVSNKAAIEKWNKSAASTVDRIYRTMDRMSAKNPRPEIKASSLKGRTL